MVLLLNVFCATRFDILLLMPQMVPLLNVRLDLTDLLSMPQMVPLLNVLYVGRLDLTDSLSVPFFVKNDDNSSTTGKYRLNASKVTLFLI